MRATVITSPGGPESLEIQERPDPEPGPGEIRVRVVASALNRADVSQRLGRYPPPAGFPPDIPGLEYAGEVDAVGQGVTLWQEGERVMGIVGGGGHAELLCVHEREAMRVPDNLTWEEAAAIPEVFLTAYDAMFLRLHMRAGENLLIHAVGSGVGTAALQLAAVAGITTIGTSRTPEKLERAQPLGLGHGIDTSRSEWEDRVLEFTGGSGVHAILDLVGGSYLASNLELLGPRGRIVLVGLTAGSKAELDMRMVLRKRLTIEGTVLRARSLEEKIALAREFSDTMLGFFESGRLRAVVDRVLPFDSVAEAHEQMEANTNFGKIVLRW
ncbi:MAG: NAD(P)H-quinone oxidoreductase [Gemmatimonadaceae bacterium]